MWTCATPAQLYCSPRAVLLIADRVANPANLGMILRTADAAGVEAVVLLGADSASPFHKHCVRAARGAMGRLPLYTCDDPPGFFHRLKTAGFALVGATVQARRTCIVSRSGRRSRWWSATRALGFGPRSSPRVRTGSAYRWRPVSRP